MARDHRIGRDAFYRITDRDKANAQAGGGLEVGSEWPAKIIASKILGGGTYSDTVEMIVFTDAGCIVVKGVTPTWPGQV